jgi:hypothetical protein
MDESRGSLWKKGKREVFQAENKGDPEDSCTLPTACIFWYMSEWPRESSRKQEHE